MSGKGKNRDYPLFEKPAIEKKKPNQPSNILHFKEALQKDIAAREIKAIETIVARARKVKW